MTRGGKSKNRAEGPERRCIATGQTLPQRDLLRFVVGPDQSIVPDVLGRLPGKGIWVRADRAALDKAVAKGLFKRAARAPVTVPENLTDRVEELLSERVTSLLAVARKAGQATAGYDRVKTWLQTEQAAVLVQASDGSERGKKKLRPPPGDDSYIGCLTASEIGLSFGRDSVIHGALTAGGLATRVVEEAHRLSGVRNADGRKAAGKDTNDA